MNTRNPDKHLPALSGMSGLAVLVVFISHTSGRDMQLASWLNFHGIGHIGVYLFFVLSGFLLAKNLLNGQPAGQYFSRRFFRIAPLYFFVLLGVVAFQAAGNYSPTYLHIEGGWEGIFLHFMFLKGDGVFWTIAAEFAFYLLLPLMILLIGRFGWEWLAVGAVLYFAWFILIQFANLPLFPLKFVIIHHNSQFLDVFALGILGAYIPFKIPEKTIAISFWGLLLLTLFCVSENFLGTNRVFFDLRWLSILYGVVFTLGVVSTTQGNRWLAKPLQNKIMVYIGVTGFGWYLLHFPVLQGVNIYLKDSSAGLRLIVSSLLLSSLSYCVFHLIERPGIHFGRKYESYFSQIILKAKRYSNRNSPTTSPK
jgi:peptidoglycan/LPS O-acetylase OafA/YrhL